VAKKMRVATLDLDDERGTGAHIINLIASTPPSPNVGLADALARFASYNVVKIVTLHAIPRYVDAAAFLEQLSEARPI